MLKIGMEVEFEGERAVVTAESADGQHVRLESASHPYPGLTVSARTPLRVLACPLCGHREPYEPAMPQERADAIEAAIRAGDDMKVFDHPAHQIPTIGRSSGGPVVDPARHPGGPIGG